MPGSQAPWEDWGTMTLTTLIALNAVFAAIVIYPVAFLHAHSVRQDRRHALSHLRSLRAVELDRDRNRDQVAA